MSIIKTCSDAWLEAGRRGSDTNRVQQEQRGRHRARWRSLPHTPQAGAIHLRNEGAQHSSAVASFRTGSSTGTGTYLVAVPGLAIAGCVSCRATAAARREPSRRLSSAEKLRSAVSKVYLPVQRVSPPPCARAESLRCLWGPVRPIPAPVPAEVRSHSHIRAWQHAPPMAPPYSKPDSLTRRLREMMRH